MEEVEIWRDIPEYEGLYQVSNFGRVKSLPRNTTKGKILKQSKHNGGYMLVGLCKKGNLKIFTVHKLVALTFIPNHYNYPCINHKDENKENNYVENLEWCDIRYNNCYGLRLERFRKSRKGKLHTEKTKQRMSEAKKGKPQYKHRKPILQYTKDMVFIRDWDSAKQAGKELGINSSNITMCCKGKHKSAYNFCWKYKEI